MDELIQIVAIRDSAAEAHGLQSVRIQGVGRGKRTVVVWNNIRRLR